MTMSKQDANQVLKSVFDEGAQALRTTQSALSEQTVVQPDGSELHVTVDSSALPSGAATSAKQDTGNASLASIDSKLTSPVTITGALTDTELRASPVEVDGSGVTQPVSAASLPLPTGAATSANQTTANASLSSIDTKLTSPLSVTGPVTDAELRATPVPVSGTVAVSNPGLTDAQLRASAVPVSAASLPLPAGAATETTLAALAAKTASSSVTVAFDEQVIAYVGATTDVSTVTYKLSGVAVATTTFSYDGSNRLTGVVTT